VREAAAEAGGSSRGILRMERVAGGEHHRNPYLIVPIDELQKSRMLIWAAPIVRWNAVLRRGI